MIWAEMVNRSHISQDNRMILGVGFGYLCFSTSRSYKFSTYNSMLQPRWGFSPIKQSTINLKLLCCCQGGKYTGFPIATAVNIYSSLISPETSGSAWYRPDGASNPFLHTEPRQVHDAWWENLQTQRRRAVICKDICTDRIRTLKLADRRLQIFFFLFC